MRLGMPFVRPRTYSDGWLYARLFSSTSEPGLALVRVAESDPPPQRGGCWCPGGNRTARIRGEVRLPLGSSARSRSHSPC